MMVGYAPKVATAFGLWLFFVGSTWIGQACSLF